MSALCLRTATFFTKGLHISGGLTGVCNPQSIYCGSIGALTQVTFVRNGTFFNKKDAESVWDSITSVSSQGRKRGRASRGKLRRRQNFNMGQFIGEGKSGMVFPGLNTPLLNNKRLVRIGEGDGPKINRENILSKRSNLRKSFKQSIPALQRGYTGSKLPGCRIGPPDPIEGYTFEGFDTIVLESKRVANVTASQGKVMCSSILVVTGNGKGLAGFAVGKALDGKAAIRNAKNKAAQRLVYIDRFEDHTLWHNFHEVYHKTKITAYKKHKGHGLVCHRVLKSICQLIGIKDVRIKIDRNPRNTLSVTKAFFAGIQRQKTHQELADELGHHIVEYRGERDFYPMVKASPTKKSVNEDFIKDDDFDFETYFFGNRLPLQKKTPPFYAKFHSYRRKMFRNYKFRNQLQSKQDRKVLGLDNEFAFPESQKN